MKRPILIAVVLILLGGAYAAYRFNLAQPNAVKQAAATFGITGNAVEAGPLQASGIVEAHSVLVSSELGGRITSLDVAEGDSVVAGQPLLAVDDSLLQARAAQADAAIAEAEAQLALLQAGARGESIAHAQAQLAQAEIDAEAAKQAWDDAELLRERPDDLDLARIEAETGLVVAEHQAKAARLQAEAADLQHALWGRVTKLLAEGFDVSFPFGSFHVDKPAERDQANTQWNVSGQQAWEAWQTAYAADDAVTGASTALADLRRQRGSLISLDAQVNQAEAAYQRAAAAIDQARAAVQGLEEGATCEEIEVTRQTVEQTRAARASLEVQQSKARVGAPLDGLVTQVVIRTGEVALPAAPLIEIADLREVTLKIYVPTPDLNHVRLGQPVQVTVNSFPDRIFEGRVTRIADQAEFTPRTVQTKEERVNTVFAVEISLANPDRALKPGMPADATFRNRDSLPFIHVSPPMKRTLLILLAVLLLAGSFLVVLAVAPMQVERTWRAAGLPPGGLRKLAALLPGQVEIGLSEPTSQPVALIASGTLEAEETQIASEIAGRVTDVLADEGQAVEPGQPLLHLDDTFLQAQLTEADQAVLTAQANLALAQAGPRPSQVNAAKAALRQAQAVLDGAKQGQADAQRARDELEELDAQIHAAQSRVALADRQIEQARARHAAIGALRESIAGDGSDQGKTQQAIYDKQQAAAAELIAAAEQEAGGARRLLRFLQGMRANPVVLDTRLRSAEGQVRQAEAGVRLAETALTLSSAGARPEAVALAEAKLAQAEAARNGLRVQAARYAITSPLAGIVTSRIADPGEMAAPGVPLLVVADLSQITLVVYVPEPRIGQVRVGQQAQVTVDAYPGRTFAGAVSYISPRAEFTPKNVQTQEERVSTVFAVEIKLANADHLLKPGMPADAEIEIR